MAIRHRFKVPMPKGYRKFEPVFEVAGLHHRRGNLIKIMKNRTAITFTLIPEPGNRHDRNAIKLVASRKGLIFTIRRQLGYIPADIAAHIATTNLLSVLLFRPSTLWVGDRGGISLTGDLIGPKEHYEQYLQNQS